MRTDFHLEVEKAKQVLGVSETLPQRINLTSMSKVLELVLGYLMAMNLTNKSISEQVKISKQTSPVNSPQVSPMTKPSDMKEALSNHLLSQTKEALNALNEKSVLTKALDPDKLEEPVSSLLNETVDSMNESLGRVEEIATPSIAAKAIAKERAVLQAQEVLNQAWLLMQ